MQVQSLGEEDPLGNEMATLSSILAWRILWTEEPGGLQSTELQRVRHNSDVQADFRKGRGTRDHIANIHWIIKKVIEFQKIICFTDYTKAFDCMDHNKLWKILKMMGIPGHLTCLLRNLYAGQEATVKTGNGTMDWFKIGKRSTTRLYILSPCLFNLYAEYIM